MAEPRAVVLSSGRLNQWYLAERGKRKGKRENDVLDNLSKGVKRAPSSHGHSSKGWADEAEESLDWTALVGCMDRPRGRMEELVAGPRDGVFQAKIRKSPGNAPVLFWQKMGRGGSWQGPETSLCRGMEGLVG